MTAKQLATTTLTERLGRGNRATRERWIIAQLAALPGGARLLDAGAGEQPFRQHCAHLQYVAQDFAAYDGRGDGAALQMGQWQYRGLDFVSDIALLPIANAQFDAVLCSEVLEHVPDPIAAVHELGRVLRPGGKLILTAPIAAVTHFAPYFFHTGFSRYWYETHLAHAGFDIDSANANGSYFAFLAQELRRLPQVARRYGGMSAPGRFVMRLLVRWLIALMAPSARRDTSSSELACFGWHVVATRRAD